MYISLKQKPRFPYLPCCDYLSLSMIRAMLLVKNLMVLELDLCGTLLILQQEHHDDFHICMSIGALFTTLRHL